MITVPSEFGPRPVAALGSGRTAVTLYGFQMRLY